MTEEADKKPYVIKRIKVIKKASHHGGSWKIAYADFVTAMMAFFLLMWLLALMNKYQIRGVAEYFHRPFSQVFKNHGNTKELGIDKDKDVNKDKEKEKQKPQQAANDPKEVQAMMEQIKKNFETNPDFQDVKGALDFQITEDGLRIDLHDLKNQPMFSQGKADFEEYAQKVVEWLSQQINQYSGKVMIIGHTDGLQYDDNDGYTNWELSSDRANAARRALVGGGLDATKIIRVVGVADTELLNQKTKDDPINRRIEIIVLSKKGLSKLMTEEEK